jgi:hypothetical protein
LNQGPELSDQPTDLRRRAAERVQAQRRARDAPIPERIEEKWRGDYDGHDNFYMPRQEYPHLARREPAAAGPRAMVHRRPEFREEFRPHPRSASGRDPWYEDQHSQHSRTPQRMSDLYADGYRGDYYDEYRSASSATTRDYDYRFPARAYSGSHMDSARMEEEYYRRSKGLVNGMVEALRGRPAGPESRHYAGPVAAPPPDAEVAHLKMELEAMANERARIAAYEQKLRAQIRSADVEAERMRMPGPAGPWWPEDRAERGAPAELPFAEAEPPSDSGADVPKTPSTVKMSRHDQDDLLTRDLIRRGGREENAEFSIASGDQLDYIATHWTTSIQPENTPLASTGKTIMIRNLPYYAEVDPVIIDLLNDFIEGVDFIYMPRANPAGCDHLQDQLSQNQRNKGYCFVHFQTEQASKQFCTFANRAGPEYFLGGKQMSTSPAAVQGVQENLTNLIGIRSRKWRPRQGIFYARTPDGIRCASLLTLRSRVKVLRKLPLDEDDDVSRACERESTALSTASIARRAAP